jgi:hypothetical protein
MSQLDVFTSDVVSSITTAVTVREITKVFAQRSSRPTRNILSLFTRNTDGASSKEKKQLDEITGRFFAAFDALSKALPSFLRNDMCDDKNIVEILNLCAEIARNSKRLRKVQAAFDRNLSEEKEINVPFPKLLILFQAHADKYATLAVAIGGKVPYNRSRAVSYSIWIVRFLLKCTLLASVIVPVAGPVFFAALETGSFFKLPQAQAEGILTLTLNAYRESLGKDVLYGPPADENRLVSVVRFLLNDILSVNNPFTKVVAIDLNKEGWLSDWLPGTERDKQGVRLIPNPNLAFRKDNYPGINGNPFTMQQLALAYNDDARFSVFTLPQVISSYFLNIILSFCVTEDSARYPLLDILGDYMFLDRDNGEILTYFLQIVILWQVRLYLQRSANAMSLAQSAALEELGRSLLPADSEAATTMVVYETIKEKIMSNNLLVVGNHRFIMDRVPGDGNCMYASIARGLGLDAANGQQIIRNMVSDAILVMTIPAFNTFYKQLKEGYGREGSTDLMVYSDVDKETTVLKKKGRFALLVQNAQLHGGPEYFEPYWGNDRLACLIHDRVKREFNKFLVFVEEDPLGIQRPICEIDFTKLGTESRQEDFFSLFAKGYDPVHILHNGTHFDHLIWQPNP